MKELHKWTDDGKGRFLDEDALILSTGITVENPEKQETLRTP